MQGLMQTWALSLDKLLTHAGTRHGDQRLISRESSGEVRVEDYRRALKAARAFSAGLTARGIAKGDRVATLMWNNHDHLATWYGVMGVGAVVHTLNPRLHRDQIAWIAEHGGARFIVVESEFCELLASIIEHLPALELVVVSSTDRPPSAIGGVEAVSFANFLSEDSGTTWGDFEETSAAGLCYTSGTTGRPKGVLYSHRSNFLHALALNQPAGLAVGADDVVMPVVPMFHANAWGLPFVAPMAGAALVLPGRRLDGASLLELIRNYGVTVAVGVPTVWEDLLRELERTGAAVSSLRKVVVGGAAISPSIVRALSEDHGVEVVHAWGMTEMSPIGTMTSAALCPSGEAAEDRRRRLLRQGGALFPVEVDIFDPHGALCPRDDASAGALMARGPTVVSEYYRAGQPATNQDQWFDTGDIAVIDAFGSTRIVDRAKDVIKSGGEWISSIDLANAMSIHPGVRRAAVVGIPDNRWGERPLMVIEPMTGSRLDPENLVEHLRPKVPRWWLPFHFAYCSIPLGATGKVDKLTLRQLLASDEGPKIITLGAAVN